MGGICQQVRPAWIIEHGLPAACARSVRFILDNRQEACWPNQIGPMRWLCSLSALERPEPSLQFVSTNENATKLAKLKSGCQLVNTRQYDRSWRSE